MAFKLNVALPALVKTPPVPLMTPLTVPSLDCVTVKLVAPSTRLPVPLRFLMVGDPVAADTFKVPELATELELLIVPEPDKVNVPALIVVAPV